MPIRFVQVPAVALLSMALAAPAAALDYSVTIANNTSFDIVAFYASNVGTEEWTRDWLEGKALEPGQEVSLQLDRDGGYCRFDFRAVFEDGEEVIDEDLNICEIDTFPYEEQP